MRINSISNCNLSNRQNFGSLHIAVPEQRREIFSNLNERYKEQLYYIMQSAYKSIWITKNDEVFYWELDFGLNKPQKVMAINSDLTSKVKKAIDYFYMSKN